MADTFWIDDAVLVTRDGVVAAHEGVWTWTWTRPSHPETSHLIEYDTESEKWTRGTRTRPGGWVDYPLWWSAASTHGQAEQWVVDLISGEPK